MSPVSPAAPIVVCPRGPLQRWHRAPLRRRGAAALSLATPALVPAASADRAQTDVRFATFNASLNRSAAGQLIADLSMPANTQARNAAETIQRIRPDVVLIDEFDYAAAGTALRLPVPLRGRVEHRYPLRLRPERQRRS